MINFKEKMKLFVGGYYDDRVLAGERYEGVRLFDKNSLGIYNLEEVAGLGFIESGIKSFEEQEEKSWSEFTFEEKVSHIVHYAESDELATIVYFDTEEKAQEYFDEQLAKIKEIEKEIVYVGKDQDRYGYYHEVYKYIEDYFKDELVGEEVTLLRLDNKIREILNTDNDNNSIFNGDTKAYVYENGSYSYYLNDEENLNVIFELVEDREDMFEVTVKVVDIELI